MEEVGISMLKGVGGGDACFRNVPPRVIPHKLFKVWGRGRWVSLGPSVLFITMRESVGELMSLRLWFSDLLEMGAPGGLGRVFVGVCEAGGGAARGSRKEGSGIAVNGWEPGRSLVPREPV